jgi:peptidoglycan/LPS O-acetylase OafA/YrhL
MAAPAAVWSGDTLRAGVGGRVVAWLSGVSYSVFLVHFGVSLVVNAGVTAAWPDAVWANALGMGAALLLSLASAAALYRWVEHRTPSWWRWWLWAGVFKASVALALLINPGG